MKRRVLRYGAIIGATTVSTLVVAPAFAAAATSQATAQSLQLSIAGNPAVTQLTTAENDGSTEHVVHNDTIPALAGVIPGNNALSAGVGVQKAQANGDGTSFACAGVAGTGGGLVTVGNSSCNIDGEPLTLDLATLDLDLENLLGGEGAVTEALNDLLGPVLQPIDGALQDAVDQLTGAFADTPLGEIGISGGLSAIEATCTADPDAAQGSAEIVDTSGDHTIPISVRVPDGQGGTDVTVVNLDVDIPAKPGGTNVLLNLSSVTDAVIDAVEIELSTALNGALAPLADAVEALLTPIKAQIIDAVIDGLRPLLEALDENILSLTVNDVTPGDGGRSVEVKTLDLQVLPAAQQFTGSSLVSGLIGHVTCGPNTRASAPGEPGNPNSPTNPDQPDVPDVVDSGLAGHEDHTARNVLGATAALMLLAGTAGLAGYRRMLDK